MPFRLGGRRFRHQTEYDYLCHLQAVVSSDQAYIFVLIEQTILLTLLSTFEHHEKVEILVKYNQLEYILTQIGETTKKPRAGTSPLVAVPLRLDLTPEQVEKILG